MVVLIGPARGTYVELFDWREGFFEIWWSGVQ
jgi:hypothetical protein